MESLDILKVCKVVDSYDGNDSVFRLLHDPENYSFTWSKESTSAYSSRKFSVYSVIYDVFTTEDEIDELENKLSGNYWVPKDTLRANLITDLESLDFFTKLEKKNVPMFVILDLMRKEDESKLSLENLFARFKALGCPFHVYQNKKLSSFGYYVKLAYKFTPDFADTVFRATNFVFSEIERTCETLLQIKINSADLDSLKSINPKAILVLNVVRNYISLEDRRQVIATARLLSNPDVEAYSRVSRKYDRIKSREPGLRVEFGETFRPFAYYSGFSQSYTLAGVEPIDREYDNAVYLLFALFHEIYGSDMILKTSKYFENNKNFVQKSFVNFLIAMDYLQESGDSDSPLDWVILMSDAGGEPGENAEYDDNF